MAITNFKEIMRKLNGYGSTMVFYKDNKNSKEEVVCRKFDF